MPGGAGKTDKAAGQNTGKASAGAARRERGRRVQGWGEKSQGEGRVGVSGMVMVVVLHRGSPEQGLRLALCFL